MAGYNLQDQMVLDWFGSGLNPGLFTTVINNSDPRTWLNWTRAAQKYQQKYLLIHSALGINTGNSSSKTHKKPQTPEQWKAAWNSKKGKTPMPWTPHLATRGLGGLTQMSEWNSWKQASVLPAKNKDILVAIVLKDLLNIHAPMPVLVCLHKLKKSIATTKNQPK